MIKDLGLRWFVVAAGAVMLLVIAAACTETVEVPGETVVVKEEVIKTVEVPGETVVVEKVVTETVEVPGETVTKEVVKEIMVPGETVVVEKEVVKTVEVPGETVTVEVVKEVQVPGETVVVEKEVVKTVEVPGETVVVEKVVVKEVAGKKYVTDPTTGNPVTAPEYGGTFTYAWNWEAPHPDTFSFWGAGQVAGGVVETLAIGNWAIDRDEWVWGSELIPLSAMTGSLAESWETPDDTTIVFNIRQGIHWHDKPPMNGRELTADDIEYNYHRYLGLGSGFTEASPNTALLAMAIPIESVTATDKWTVVFKLKEPMFGAVERMLGGDWTSFVYPPEVIKQHGDVEDWRNLVGTGPYELTDWTEGTSATYSKNPGYWRFDEKYPENRLPYIDTIEVLYITEPATQLAGLRAGRIDYLGYDGSTDVTNIDQVESLRGTNPEIVLHAWQNRSETSYSLDQSQPPFDDINVRKAMQMALDLETINYTYFKGTAMWQPQGAVGEVLLGYFTPFEEWPAEVKEFYIYDPEGAEKLLDEAGYPRGADGIRFKTVLNQLDRFDPGYPELAAAYWGEIGVDVEIRILAEAEWSSIATGWSWEGMRSSAWGQNEDPQTVLKGKGHSTSVWNIAKVKDAELDAMIEAIESATSLAERQRFVREADMYVIKNHWAVWGPKTRNFMPTQPWVKGYNGEIHLGQMLRRAVIARLWIDQELKEALRR